MKAKEIAAARERAFLTPEELAAQLTLPGVEPIEPAARQQPATQGADSERSGYTVRAKQ